MENWQKIIIGLILIGVIVMRKISQHGIDKIKEHEDLRLTPYQDVGGKWTIGYGHLIRTEEPELMHRSGISRDKAEQLLRQDLQTAEKAVSTFVQVPITQNQYDALVSFIFNVGVYAFEKSTMLKKLNVKDYDGAANEFKRWVIAGGQVSTGLKNRRAREERLFRT